MRNQNCAGRNWLGWQSGNARRRLRQGASFLYDGSMIDNLLGSRRWRHVADARRFRCSDEFGMEVAAAIGRSLVDFNLNTGGNRVALNSKPQAEFR
jgi:hypothetical protein